MGTPKSYRVPVGLDKGYAWIVALSCFFINFLLVGIARSAAVMYVALVNTYHVSRQAASLPFIIRVALRNLTGPLIGLLGQKYGIRPVTTLGGLVAGLGSILCYFAPNIFWITIFWGVIHGIGFGLSTVIHMMIINQYFDKYKASALGLGYSGDCFGTFAFPVIMEYLLANYNVKETFLILGGIVLNVIPLAMLLRKPPWMRSKKKSRNYLKNVSSQVDQINNKDQTRSQGYRKEAYLNFEEDLSPSKDIDSKITYSKKTELEKGVNVPTYDDVDSRQRFNHVKCNMPLTNGSFRSLRAPPDLLRENMERHDSLPPVIEKDSSLTGSTGFETIAFDDVVPQCEDLKPRSASQQVQCPTGAKKRTSSFVSQMAVDIVHRMRSASFASQVAQDGFISNFQQEQKDDSDGEDEYDGQRKLSIDKNGCCKSCGQEVVLQRLDSAREPSQLSFRTQPPKQHSVLQTLISTNTRPIFILISTTMAVYAFLFVGVLTIIIDYGVDQGVSNDQGKYLIIGFSVTDLFGRLSFGQVIDRKLVKMKNYSGVSMLLMGTLVAVIPLNKSFNYMMVCMCLYGFVQGGTAIQFPILVSHYMEKHEESVAMGCLNFFGGLLMLCMAPMIGYFRDNTGSYNWVFHILGSLAVFVGIIWQTEPLIIKLQRKQQLKKANQIVTSNF